MKSIITFAATALLAGSIAGQAQANTVWHFPYKGAPYATNTDTVASPAVVSAPKANLKPMSHLLGKKK